MDGPDTANGKESDIRNRVARFIVKMSDWNLSKLQRQRLIFLLGPRYKGKDTFKIRVD
jgi:hypothetical protein